MVKYLSSCFSIGKALFSRGQHLAGVAEVGVGQRLRAEDVHRRHRQQRRADAVAAHVEQVDGEVVGVEPVVAERVAAQVRRGDEAPVDPDRALGQRRRQQRRDVLRRLRHLVGEVLLALGQLAVRLVALQQGDVALRVVADPGDQFELVGQLDEVVVGPDGERLGLDGRLLLAGQHDQRHLARRLVGPEELHQRQAVDLRHDEVLQDDRRADRVGRLAMACVGSWQKWKWMSGSAASIRRTASPTMAWSSTSRTVTGCSAAAGASAGRRCSSGLRGGGRSCGLLAAGRAARRGTSRCPGGRRAARL